MNRRTVLAGTAAAMASPFLTAVPSLADARRQSLVDQSLNSARKVLSGKDYPDALRNMGKARGVIIVPELVQGGFILGAAGGRGILMGRTSPTHWTYPAFYGLGSGSIGFQAFSQSRLYLRLKEAWEQFNEAAGFDADSALLESIAGRESALALYDIGDLTFLYVTRLPSSRTSSRAGGALGAGLPRTRTTIEYSASSGK